MKPNAIDADIPMTEEVKKFVQFITDRANLAGRSVILKNDEFLFDKDLRCGGYYDDDDNTLAVACKKPMDIWLGVLVHESCHMDQDIEQCESWKKYDDVDAGSIMDGYLASKLELLPEQKKYWFQLVQELEWDCERRTVKRLIEYNLPLDVTAYLKSANAYVYFYTMAAQLRKWYVTPPYATQIVDAMPSTFLELEDYWTVSPELQRLYEEHCFKEQA